MSNFQNEIDLKFRGERFMWTAGYWWAGGRFGWRGGGEWRVYSHTWAHVRQSLRSLYRIWLLYRLAIMPRVHRHSDQINKKWRAFSWHDAFLVVLDKSKRQPFPGMMPSWSFLARAKDNEALFKKPAVWLNGLNTHESPELQGLNNPCWRDDFFFVFLFGEFQRFYPCWREAFLFSYLKY